MEEKDLNHPNDLPEAEMPALEIPIEEIPAPEIPIEEVVLEAVSETETAMEGAPAVEASVKDAPVEDTPVDGAPVEELSVEEVPPEEAPIEEAPIEEAPAEESPTEAIPVEVAPAMEAIPQEDSPLDRPEASEEILPDEQAMAWHGMTDPSEADQPFDLSVLDDLGLDDESLSEEGSGEPGVPDQQYQDSDSDFDTIFSAPAQEPEVPTHSRPTRKGRPKRKKGEGLLGIPHMLVTVVWLAIILAVGVTLGRMLWVCAAEVLAFGKPDQVVTITVYESDTVEDVTEKLHKAGLIRYPGLFKLYADLAVDEGEIDPGIWDLNTRYDYHALVNSMNASSSRAIVEDLLIPEGYTCLQIFDLLEEKKVCTAKDLKEYAANGELKDYWFLEGVERGTENCLEGFLFPDTYDFYKNSSPREVLEKLMNNFENKFDEELQLQILTLNDRLADLMRKDGRSEETIAASRFTARDVIIVASLIEKETASNAESYTIASVIYNRLFNWGSTPAYLNIDASIIYAQGGDSEKIDTKLDSPYNTYLNTGLTPGPIANPGLASIKAALSPADSNYYFYVLNPATGVHQFSTTLAEHEQYVAQFAAAGGD